MQHWTREYLVRMEAARFANDMHNKGVQEDLHAEIDADCNKQNCTVHRLQSRRRTALPMNANDFKKKMLTKKGYALSVFKRSVKGELTEEEEKFLWEFAALDVEGVERPPLAPKLAATIKDRRDADGFPKPKKRQQVRVCNQTSGKPF